MQYYSVEDTVIQFIEESTSGTSVKACPVLVSITKSVGLFRDILKTLSFVVFTVAVEQVKYDILKREEGLILLSAQNVLNDVSCDLNRAKSGLPNLFEMKQKIKIYLYKYTYLFLICLIKSAMWYLVSIKNVLMIFFSIFSFFFQCLAQNAFHGQWKKMRKRRVWLLLREAGCACRDWLWGCDPSTPQKEDFSQVKEIFYFSFLIMRNQVGM